MENGVDTPAFTYLFIYYHRSSDHPIYHHPVFLQVFHKNGKKSI